MYSSTVTGGIGRESASLGCRGISGPVPFGEFQPGGRFHRHASLTWQQASVIQPPPRQKRFWRVSFCCSMRSNPCPGGSLDPRRDYLAAIHRRSCRREKDVSTKQARAQAPARLQGPHGHQGWPPGHRPAPCPWTQEAFSLNLACAGWLCAPRCAGFRTGARFGHMATGSNSQPVPWRPASCRPKKCRQGA